MTLYFFYTIFGLILYLIIFLYSFYTVLGKRQLKQENAMEGRSKDIIVPAQSATRSAEKLVLNRVPVPQKAQFTGGKIAVEIRSLLFQED